MSPEPEESNPPPQQPNPEPPPPEMIISKGAGLPDAVQAILHGNVEGDLVLGNKIYMRSEVEELDDYLRGAMAEFENRMSQILLDNSKPDSPFKSLDFFTVEDASIFFGRRAATGELFDKVVGNRIMILYGRSGAGKSSILNAGLSPLLLREARLPVYVRIHPFEDNLVQEIKQAIFPPSNRPWPRLLHDLSLHEFLGLACTHRSRRTRELVVILDQFEQFLISLPNPDIRQPFIEALRDCYEDRTLPVRFVLSVQHENLGDLDPFEQYIPLILQNRYSLPPMSETEVKETITGPIQQIDPGISFEPALLDELFKELGGKNVELTHLQIVCSQLYSSLHEGQQVITTSLYQQLGGVDKILSTYLDTTLEPLSDYKHKVARIILMELVSSEGTNRILGLTDFSRVVPPDPNVLEEVVQYLVNHRLLRRGSAREEKEYELSHAYLAQEITHWIGRDALDNKRAQDLLQRELVNWRLFHILIDPEELNLLRNHLKYLSLDADAREMILYSCLEHGHDVDFWIEQMEDRNAATRQAATFAVTNEKITEQLKSGLSRDLHPDLLSTLWKTYNVPDAAQKREAAKTLWILRDWLSREETSRLRRFLLPVWAQQRLQQNIRPLLVMAVFVVPFLTWFLFIRERPIPGEWVVIEAGSFVMGMDKMEAEYAHKFCIESATNSEDCDSETNLLLWSGRQISATLEEYSILDNEVTFAQYQQCVDAGKCDVPTNTSEEQREINLPATNLTWLQAEAYCEWLGGRLPTESEWEKAARGPDGNYFPWGSPGPEAWDPNWANIENFDESPVVSVNQFADTDVSVYGIKNMAGNVQEWTSSECSFEKGTCLKIDGQEFLDSVLSTDAANKAIEEALRKGIDLYPAEEDHKKALDESYKYYPTVILRGGSWETERSSAFASSRTPMRIDKSWPQIGFRCACQDVGICSTPWNGWWIWLSLH